MNRVINKMKKSSQFYAKSPIRTGDIILFNFLRRPPGIIKHKDKWYENSLHTKISKRHVLALIIFHVHTISVTETAICEILHSSVYKLRKCTSEYESSTAMCNFFVTAAFQWSYAWFQICPLHVQRWGWGRGGNCPVLPHLSNLLPSCYDFLIKLGTYSMFFVY